MSPILALVLAACTAPGKDNLDDTGPDDTGPDDTGVEIVAPDDPSPDPCDRLQPGAPGAGDLALALSEAHADLRFFGAEGQNGDAFVTVDAALAAALEGDDAWTTPDLDAYAATLTETCALDATGAALGPATVTLVGDVALVVPGSGDVALPAGAAAVAVDLRDLPADTPWEVLAAAVAPALATPVDRLPRRVRGHTGLVGEYAGWSTAGIYDDATYTLTVDPLAATGAADLPLALLTDADLAPAAAELALTLRDAGRAAVWGEAVLAAVAESTWKPVGARGLAFRTRYLLHDGQEPVPDTLPADVRAADPTLLLPTLAGLGTLEAVAWGEAARPAVRSRDPVGQDRDGALTRGGNRAAALVAHGLLRRFYPYFTDDGVTPAALDARLLEVLPTFDDPDLDRRSVLVALGRIGNVLADGHHFLYALGGSTGVVSCLPVMWETTADGPVAVRSEQPEVAVGDALVAVDGAPYAEWLAATEAHLGGTTAGYREDIALRELSGIYADPRVLTLRAPDGAERTETIAEGSCDPFYEDEFYLRDPRDHGPLDDLGAADLYYINLDTARMRSSGELADELTAAQGAAGLVLDMRGYPGGVNHYEVAQRIMTETFTSAYFVVPRWQGPDLRDETVDQYTFSPRGDPSFAGPIAVLVGPHAVSAAENFMMMLTERVTFVGRPSAGTNGNITSFYLPGDFLFTFTGMEVLFPDGSDFHGIGITPDVPAEPTQASIAAGRDPVLEAAITTLHGG